MKTIISLNKVRLDQPKETQEACVVNKEFAQICVTGREKQKSFFYETDSVWVFVYGTVYDAENHYVRFLNPAKSVVEKFSGDVQEFLLSADGSFVVIIYNKISGKYVISRDLIGLQHAYYTSVSGNFCLSTEITEILEYRKQAGTELNYNSLDLYLTFQYLPQPHTMFSDVYQLPTSGMLNIDKGNLKTIPFAGTFPEMLVMHKAPNPELKNILINSMKRQVENGGTVGAFLSGGMDTSTNIGILAGVLGVKPIVFTAGFKEASYDETPYAKIMAEKYGLKHQIFTIGPDVIEKLPEVAAIYDNPIADRAIFPEYIICDVAKSMNITSMVSGEGGDEVLGYPRNIPEDAIFDSSQKTNNNLATYYYSLSSLVQKPLREELMSKKSTHQYLEDLYTSFGNVQDFEKIYYGQWQTWMIDNVYIKDIRLFGKNNMSFVSPYMDIALMRHNVMLSTSDKLNLLRNKMSVKKSMSDLLPEKIINKQKHKFHVPINEWLKNEYYGMCYETLTAKDSLSMEFMDRKVLKRMLSEHKNGTVDHNRPLWGLLFLEYWYKGKKKYL